MLKTNQFRNYTTIISLLLLFTLVRLEASAQLFNLNQLELIARDFSFTEGPAVDRQGNIYFTDQPNNKIWKYSTQGKLTLFKANAGRANGLYFDRNNNLLACADENNEIWSINRNGKIKVVLSKFEGKRLNGPNDLWVDQHGGIYFTDPYYQRDYWLWKKPEIKEQRVYYLAPKQTKPIIVANDLVKPNGIIGSADGKYLFVADIEQDKTYKYRIGNNGELKDKQLLINKGSDGMTLDAQGNIYLTGNGVFIYSPQGILIQHIKINEPWTANVCFGGKDRATLFITASTAIYKLPMLRSASSGQ